MDKDKVRAIIAKLGMTQREFAQAVGVSLSTAASWCQGVRSPNEENVEKINKLEGGK